MGSYVGVGEVMCVGGVICAHSICMCMSSQ